MSCPSIHAQPHFLWVLSTHHAEHRDTRPGNSLAHEDALTKEFPLQIFLKLYYTQRFTPTNPFLLDLSSWSHLAPSFPFLQICFSQASHTYRSNRFLGEPKQEHISQRLNELVQPWCPEHWCCLDQQRQQNLWGSLWRRQDRQWSMQRWGWNWLHKHGPNFRVWCHHI